MNVTTTKEKIISTADKHPEFKEVLKSLFPEAFADEVNIDFMPGDKLIQKDGGKIYLIAVDNDKYLRMVSITSGHLWADKRVKVYDDRRIKAHQVRTAFGLRNLKGYILERNNQKIAL